VQDDLPVSGQSSGWQAWEPGKTEQLLAQGRPVFVDFTAAWCVTCQYNKKTTLADQAVLKDFETKKVQLLRADWTRRDPAITQALTSLGRSGVPVYVLYKPGSAPVIMSEILSVTQLQEELAKL
jgi:thiol:disulfide interchange protein DsbD